MIALLGLGLFATAGNVDVQVRGPGGVPLADAVVTLSGPRFDGSVRFPWPYVVKQQNIAFQPHVLIAPVGAARRQLLTPDRRVRQRRARSRKGRAPK